jgi:hypothetical protein
VLRGDAQDGDDRLCGVAVTACRRSQAVADLAAAASWLTLEADPPDRPPVRQAGDPVVAEGLLVAEVSGGAEEGSDGADVALEREIVCPGIGSPRRPGDDASSLGRVDRVQPHARLPGGGHRTSEAGRTGRHHGIVTAGGWTPPSG